MKYPEAGAGDRDQTPGVKGNRLLVGSLLVFLALLVWYSVHLSLSRIYQVDECQNFYMAKVFATGQSSEFFTTSSLFLFGPLSWLAQADLRSTEMFAAARLLFLVVFWFNLVLLAWILGGRLFSIRSLIALVGASTLAPLWDYGFEIRHDNLVLAGMLVTWWLIRIRPIGLSSYMLTGAIAVTLLFIAVKSVVYVLPLSFAVLAFPPPVYTRSRWQLGLAWIGGALLAGGFIRVCYGSEGAWEHYMEVFRGVSTYSSRGDANDKFWPGIALERLLTQTPLLLALTFAGYCAIASDIIRRGKIALSWSGNLPEALLLTGALGALLINPTPFPYNLVHLVPYAFVFAFKYGSDLLNKVRDRTDLWPLVGTILVFVHLVPFEFATRRHMDRNNVRQNELMRVAEDLTDPKNDPVYDGIGIVLTRPSIHYQWYLHSLNVRSFINNPGSQVRDMLAAKPAAVFIPSYRTSWLPPEDHDFIKQQYVPLADDFWVLGTVLPPGGGNFEVVHPGRYRITSLGNSGIAADYIKQMKYQTPDEGQTGVTGTLDGIKWSDTPVELTVGTHRVETTPDCQPAIVWVGPRLDKAPGLRPGNHLSLFVNWY